jgi:hypothetical protein
MTTGDRYRICLARPLPQDADVIHGESTHDCDPDQTVDGLTGLTDHEQPITEGVRPTASDPGC